MISEDNNAVFDARYVIVSESGCWIWTGQVNGDGYGRMRSKATNGRFVMAHRYAYARHVGAIPEGACVCHRCDVPICVNPDHLWVGSHAENMADRNAKGRASGGSLCGASSPASKLTEKTVAAIKSDPRSYNEICREYGIAKSHVSRIKHGKTWAHLSKDLASANSAPGGSRKSSA